LQSRTCTGCIF